jgi:hypothetical protein
MEEEEIILVIVLHFARNLQLNCNFWKPALKLPYLPLRDI